MLIWNSNESRILSYLDPVDEAENTVSEADAKEEKKAEDQNPMDFAANIEKVKEVSLAPF